MCQKVKEEIDFKLKFVVALFLYSHVNMISILKCDE